MKRWNIHNSILIKYSLLLGVFEMDFGRFAQNNVQTQIGLNWLKNVHVCEQWHVLGFFHFKKNNMNELKRNTFNMRTRYKLSNRQRFKEDNKITIFLSEFVLVLFFFVHTQISVVLCAYRKLYHKIRNIIFMYINMVVECIKCNPFYKHDCKLT